MHAASILVAIQVHLAASPTWAQGEATQTTKANSIRLRVIGPNGRAVKDAAIHVSVWTDEPFKRNQDFRTDGNGEVE